MIVDFLIRIPVPRFKVGEYAMVPGGPQRAGGIVRIERAQTGGIWSLDSSTPGSITVNTHSMSYTCTVQDCRWPNGDPVPPGTVWIISIEEDETLEAAVWYKEPFAPNNHPQ